MNSSLRIAFIAQMVVAVAGLASAKTRTGISAEQTLSIHVYDQARVSEEVLRLSFSAASELFRPAASRIIWDRPSAEVTADHGIDMTSPEFQQPDERGYLVLRLLGQTPGTVFPGALGLALPFAHSGAHALIFYDRVEAVAQRTNTAIAVVLAYSIAHEIGHVLLRSAEHSNGGLMQAHWPSETWRLAFAGLLAFSPNEIERIGAGVRTLQARNALPEHKLSSAFAP